jgi:gliding motility-associated-like protein
MSTVDQFTFLWESADPAHLAFLSQTDIRNPIADIPDDFTGEIIYNITVESLDGTCFETKELIIDIKEDLEIIINDTIICQDIGQLDLVVNVDNGIGNLTAEWSNNQGRLDWLTDFSLTPGVTIPADFIGTTTFTIEVTDATGFCSATEMFTIDVREQINLPVLGQIDIPCEEGDINLGENLNIDPSLEIAWYLNNQLISNDQVINVSSPGDYILEVSNGICTFLDTALVSKDDGIREASLDNLSLICSNIDLGEILVSVSDGGLAPFEYFINGTSVGNDPSIDDIPLGMNELVIVDANNCRFTIPFEVPFPLNTTLDIGEDREVELGLNTQATLVTNLMGDEIFSLEWFFNNQSLACDNCNEIDFTPTQDGFLQLELTNENGCLFRDSLLVTVFELGKDLFAPNVFSPNGDNINDRFTIFGGEGVAVIESLQVYDRWGNQVYSASNLPINDASQGWDGRYKGKPLNAGVFIFYARLLLTNQKFKEIKGDVAIIK